MKHTALDLLACPCCGGDLGPSDMDSPSLRTGNLFCSRCKRNYPIVDGIPHFIQPETLTGFNRRFARLYNWFS